MPRSVALVVLALVALPGCAGVTKLDVCHLGSRDFWQRPNDVVRALALEPGARVADVGAGDGYFVPFLAEAVGSGGRVYAIELDEAMLEALGDQAARLGLDQVQVVRATPDDAGLGAESVDLVLLVNTYHHIEDRPAYFRSLQGSLAPGARVAVIEPNEELRGVLSLFLDEGHTSRADAIREEMDRAGFEHLASHDFLPVQRFEVFGAGPALAGRR